MPSPDRLARIALVLAAVAAVVAAARGIFFGG